MLRFVSYLSPSVPESVFEALASHVGASIGAPVSVRFETRTSGPMPGDDDPFAADAADVGFLCAPSYLWLARRAPAAVELIPFAPVYDDPRAAGRPVYFSDVICRADLDVATFADLRGRTFACNDPASLSGALSLFARLREAGDAEGFFERLVWSGSHLASIRYVRGGEVAAAAIDSTVLRRVLAADASVAADVRVLESWGPYPVQPLVIRAALPSEIKRGIAAAVASACTDGAPGVRAALAAAGLVAFAPVTEAFYEAAGAVAGGQLPSDFQRSARSLRPSGAM